MEFDFWAATIATVAGVLVAIVSEFVPRAMKLYNESRTARLSRDLQITFRGASESSSAESLDAKIAKARELSDEAARLNAEVKSEFDLQLAAAEQAKVDAEIARREANNAEAVKKQYDAAIEAARGVIASELEGVVAKNAKADRRFQILVALISFLAGVAATTVVSLILQAAAAG